MGRVANPDSEGLSGVTKEKGGYLMGVLTRGDYRRRLILLAAALGLAIAMMQTNPE